MRLNRGNGFVPICKCGEWNGQGCNYGLKENVVGCDAKSTLNADAGDSGSGANLKYLFLCSRSYGRDLRVPLVHPFSTYE
jgi:hypothetical protein